MFWQKNKWFALSCLLSLGLVILVYHLYDSQPIQADRLRIGATYMTMNSDFYINLNAEIEKLVDEKGDVLYARDPAFDIDKQCQQIEDFIAKKVDAIILNPVDGKSKKLVRAVQKARRAGILVIVIDSRMQDNSVADTTITSDNYQAGVLAAEEMMANHQEAKILILEHKSAYSATDRIQGFVDTIKDKSAYQIVGREDCQGQTELAMPIVEQAIDKQLGVTVIMSLNDRSGIGALAGIKNRGASDIAIYSIDGSPEMKTILAETNDVAATVSQSPIQMANQSLEAIYSLKAGQSVKSLITIPVETITKENINQYDVTGWQ